MTGRPRTGGGGWRMTKDDFHALLLAMVRPAACQGPLDQGARATPPPPTRVKKQKPSRQNRNLQYDCHRLRPPSRVPNDSGRRALRPDSRFRGLNLPPFKPGIFDAACCETAAPRPAGPHALPRPLRRRLAARPRAAQALPAARPGVQDGPALSPQRSRAPAPVAFPAVNRACTARLHVREGRLAAANGGLSPARGQCLDRPFVQKELRWATQYGAPR